MSNDEMNARIREAALGKQTTLGTPPADPFMTQTPPPSETTDWGGGARGPNVGGSVPAGLHGRLEPADMNARIRNAARRER